MAPVAISIMMAMAERDAAPNEAQIPKALKGIGSTEAKPVTNTAVGARWALLCAALCAA